MKKIILFVLCIMSCKVFASSTPIKNFSAEDIHDMAVGAFDIIVTDGETPEMVQKAENALFSFCKNENNRAMVIKAYDMEVKAIRLDKSGKRSFDRLVQIGNKLGIK